jgi:hypothetical protein
VWAVWNNYCVTSRLYKHKNTGGKRIVPLASASTPALGPTQPPIQWVSGGPFPGDKERPVRGADHSPRLVPRTGMSTS